MELHGVTGSPYATPQVRRNMPAPFTRPSIHVGGGARSVKRAWQDISVLDVKRGDTVASFGTVVETKEFTDTTDTQNVIWRVRLYNVMGDWIEIPGEQRVYAFTAEQP